VLERIEAGGKATKLALAAALIGVSGVLLFSAWLCDDAYITFRTVDNFVSGRGLTWNAVERVQGYTHPLWMFLVSGFYTVTGDIYYTTIALQIALTLAVGAVLFARVARGPVRGLAAMAAIVLSKAFVDFSTSGLENPLSHLLLVGFCAALFSPSRRPYRRLGLLTLLASAALLTRLDNLLLTGPALCLEVGRLVRADGLVRAARRGLPWLVSGVAPLLLWELFSAFYYGFLLPNTAYAKLATGIPLADYAAQGLRYLVNSLHLDPLTLLTVGLGLALGLARGDGRSRALSIGVALHLVYVVRAGGDFMSGRFLTASFLVAVVVLSRVELREEWLYRTAAAAFLLLAAAAGSFPTLDWWYVHGSPSAKDAHGIADHRRELYPATGLFHRDRQSSVPNHDWAERGLRFRETHVDKAPRLGGTGFTGFYAGPGVYIADMWALTDPLLARLPFDEVRKGRGWRPGHFHRSMPEGYHQTLLSGRNAIADPDLHAYYDKLVLITRADLCAPGRFEAIWEINTGGYDHLVERYWGH
jgi:arabinofuranosyltransferase